jgi:parvulin-like peptidyl-prolyl isomerase
MIYNGNNNWYTRTAETIVPYPFAQVNGTYISLSRFRTEVATRQFYASKHEQAISESETNQFVSNLLIQRLLANQELRKQNLSIDESTVQDELDRMIEEAGGIDIVRKYLKDEWGPEATLQLLKIWLRDTAAEQTLQSQLLTRVTARHILLSTPSGATADQIASVKQKAETLQATLTTLEQFSDAAAQQSADINSRDKGGLLGTFGRSDGDPVISAEFEDAAFTGEVNKVLGPVQSSFGWHLLYIENREGTIDQSKQRFLTSLREQSSVHVFLPQAR